MIDINEITMTLGRSILLILSLFLVTKILGKKQLSQLTVYDYIIGITIGSVAADSIISLDKGIINGVVAVFTFGFIGLGISYLTIKSAIANEIINGKPLFLMEEGEFNFENLRKSKISIVKFIEESRLKGYYDINVLNYAILETNGQISFLPKEEYQISNPIDFKADIKKGTKQTLCTNLVVDGEIQKDALEEVGKDEEWLKKELKKQKINDSTRVLLATLDQKNKIKIFRELL